VRFLLDQDVYALTARFLRAAGHDVVTAAEIDRAKAIDSELLLLARDQERIFVTRDRDFGSLVFVEYLQAGVFYLRISPSTIEAVHEELAVILAQYPEETLRRAFCVVSPGRHRLRKLSPAQD
jgi:predicted nuclease of predicted toxin-antitoxin system